MHDVSCSDQAVLSIAEAYDVRYKLQGVRWRRALWLVKGAVRRGRHNVERAALTSPPSFSFTARLRCVDSGLLR